MACCLGRSELDRQSPKDRRFRTTLTFSVVCLVLVAAATRALDVRLDPEDTDTALAMMVPAFGLALTSVMASGLLVSALLECRPALRDPRGRWLWLWTLVFCVAFMALGSSNGGLQTIGQAVLFASSRVVAFIGAVGLLVAAIPPWSRTAGR